MGCEKCKYDGAPQRYGSYGEQCPKCGTVFKEDVEESKSKENEGDEE